MISTIQRNNNYIEVWDSYGRIISAMPYLFREVVGISEYFFAVLVNKQLEIYDEKCKKISSMSILNKYIIGSHEDTIVVINNNWIEFYDQNCMKLFSKPADSRDENYGSSFKIVKDLLIFDN